MPGSHLSGGVHPRLADHEAMLVGLDELQAAATRVRDWLSAKHHATAS
jgi:hypothetical protein